jgi:5-methylcytosine-specific restriction endonuclease McrA
MVVLKMKQCNKCKENKDTAFFGKNLANNDGLKGDCKTCRNAYNAGWVKENLEKDKASHAEYYLKNIERIKIRSAAYNLKNNKKGKVRGKAWRKANPGKVNAKTAKRRAAKLKATPKQLSKEQKKEMQAIYAEAARLTKETGIKHQVDHIIPLQGKEVSGFHAPWNLQILTKPDNNKKRNQFDFTYENESWRNNQ